MPGKGRRRLSEDDLQERIAAYCVRYSVNPGPTGLPRFPTGRRETDQHREWLSLYKAHNRLGRRRRGQCERCQAPAAEGSVFCERHRTGGAARAGAHPASAEDRRRLHKAQAGVCPVCCAAVDLGDATDHDPATAAPRGLLHARCKWLVDQVEPGGPELLNRLRAYLWPRVRTTATPRTRP